MTILWDASGMMKRALFAALAVAFLSSFSPAFAQAPLGASTACLEASAEYEEFLQSLPRTCTADEDCAGYPLRIDPCAEALMLQRKAMENQEVLIELGRQQMKAREACQNDYPPKATCKKRKYWLPECSEGVCINNWRNRPDTLDMPKGKDEQE